MKEHITEFVNDGMPKLPDFSGRTASPAIRLTSASPLSLHQDSGPPVPGPAAMNRV